MRVKAEAQINRSFSQQHLLNTQFHPVYSCASMSNCWRSMNEDSLTVVITSHHICTDDGEDFEDQLRWIRETTYGVTEA